MWSMNGHRAACLSAALLLGGLPSLSSASAGLNTSKALVPGQEYMVVANRPNNLHVVDLEKEQVFKTCDLPGGFGPGMIQMSPDRRIAYVLNNHFEDIYGIELDSCKMVFHASMTQSPQERSKSIFSFTVSADGREIYAVRNPVRLHADRYEVLEPRFVVYDADAGLKAKPVRSFPAPRQSFIMQAAPDGSLYLAGVNLYRVDVKTGERTVALPLRDWQRPQYAAPDLLYFWPIQTPSRDFTMLYTTARFKEGGQNPETAENLYGLVNVNLETGETEAREFAPLTELYFTGIRSPKDRNLLFSVLHRLAKYDLNAQKLVDAAELDHTYYTILINKAGSRVYLTGTFNDIAIYDTDSLKKVGRVDLPGGDMSAATAQIFTR